MKKLLVMLMVLILCGSANAVTISLVDEGSVIDAGLTGGVVRLEITSDNGLAAMNLIVVLTGDGCFTDAIGPFPPWYGWDPTMIWYPIISCKEVEITADTTGAPVVGPVGWVEVTYSGPVDVVVSLLGDGTQGGSWGADYTPATYSTGVVTIVPEPATIALLGLGALALLRRRK